jgi:hypothetical protein
MSAPPQIRYFRHAGIQQELSTPALLSMPRLSICLIAGAALQASIKYALPQRAGSDAIAWGQLLVICPGQL